MINLLPPEYKESVSYARRNTLLLHWAIVGLAIIGGLFAIIVAGHFYVHKSIALINRDIAQSQENLKVQKLAETQARVDEISNQVKLVVQVLSKEILFSKLLRQIGAAMPENTALTSLDVGQVQGGIDLHASALDTKAATQIQLNLQDKNNKIFDKADLNSIKCDSGDGKLYPCDVSLRALFGTNSQFYFINNGKATQ